MNTLGETSNCVIDRLFMANACKKKKPFFYESIYLKYDNEIEKALNYFPA